MKSPRNMPRLRKRPSRRRPYSQSQGCCSAAAAAASMFLSISTIAPRSSALLTSPASFFVSHQSLIHRNKGEGRGPPASSRSQSSSSSSVSKPRNLHQMPVVQRHSPRSRQSRIIMLAMNQNDDNDNSEEEEEEEEYNEMKSNLSKIAWLPSVKLGKQPYNDPALFGKKQQSGISRKENVSGDSYESLEDTSSSSSSTPPGYQNIEILPVLPMTMVHGLEGIMLDSPSPFEVENTLDTHDSSNPYYNEASTYGSGVWEEESMLSGSSSLGPLFSGTSSYLPHTKGHVFTVSEPRYKKLYDDLLRMGNYYGLKRDSALRRAKAEEEEKFVRGDGDSSLTNSMPPAGAASSASAASSLQDPDEKRRFIVTASNPSQDGVFAEYGLLFELKDLDEVEAMASYEMGGEGMTVEEIQDLVEEVKYNNGEKMLDSGLVGNSGESDGEDIMDILLRTHYEATHDVVGRVRIHRFVNPECYTEGEDDEYLMAEATVLDVVENDRVKMMNERKRRKAAAAAAAAQEVEGEQQPHQPTTTTSLTAGRKLEGQAKEELGLGLGVGGSDMAKAVARIREELRSSVGEAFKQQQQVEPESIKDKLRSVLDDKVSAAVSSSKSADSNANNASNRKKGGGPIPLGPKGMYVERRPDDSLSKPERALRESFAKLVSLQHDLKEECRFTRVSVQTFGIGPVGVWLSAAAWSQFVEKRLEASHGDMQSDLQAKLVEYLSDRGSGGGGGGLGGYFANEQDGMEGYGGVEGAAETIDFEDLSPELQWEFQLVQVRATEELGPLALERAIQMQRIVQAESYDERLDLLRECVDNERRRLEAKKMLRSLTLDSDGIVDRGKGGAMFDSSAKIAREEARSLFERLMSTDVATENKMDQSKKDQVEDAFQ